MRTAGLLQKSNPLFACTVLAVLLAGSVVWMPAIVLAQPPASGDSTNRPSDYLLAAQSALAAGRLNETQEALEMAQTRMLDRSVPLGQTNVPSDNPVNQQITQARQALAARDRTACMRLIEAAINTAAAQGL
jgi:hypothetical protein